MDLIAASEATASFDKDDERPVPSEDDSRIAKRIESENRFQQAIATWRGEFPRPYVLFHSSIEGWTSRH